MGKENGLTTDLETLGTLGDRTRTPEQAKAMKQTVGKGKCPFCPPQTENWANPAIKIIGRWTLKLNDFPYENHDYHFVIVYENHTNDISAVVAEDWSYFGELLSWAIEEYKIPGGAVAMRFGHSDYNASTVRHLHGHIQVPAKKMVNAHRQKDFNCLGGDCLICETTKDFSNFIIATGGWVARESLLLPNSKKHTVLTFNDCEERVQSLNKNNWRAFGHLVKFLTSRSNGGGIVIRFGDSRFHGGHTSGFYCEIIEPDLTGPSRAIFLTDSQTKKPICKATFAKDCSPEEEFRRKKRQKELGV